jgi:hypothetical protein
MMIPYNNNRMNEMRKKAIFYIQRGTANDLTKAQGILTQLQEMSQPVTDNSFDELPF